MDSVAIKGYKSFKDFTVSLRDINLLIGANGAGKSNFLTVFELLSNAYEQKLRAYVATAGGVDKLLYHGRKATDRIAITISEGQGYYHLSLMESDGSLIVEHELLGHHTPGGQESQTDIALYKEEPRLKEYNGTGSAAYIKDYISQIRKFHFHDTGRKSPFTADSHVRNDAYMMYEHGENLASILYRIREGHPTHYRRIIRVIQSVAPYFSDFYLHPTGADTLRLQWQDKFSNMVYGPSDLSDGTIRFIAMTVLFMQPSPPKVIIIDEPELGLHPFAIAKLASLIRTAAKNGSQIIAATQSADLISHFEPQDIITVDQGAEGSSMRRLAQEELAHWLGDYTLGELWKQNIINGGQPA